MILDLIQKLSQKTELLSSDKAWNICKDDKVAILGETDIEKIKELWIEYIALNIRKYSHWGLTELMFEPFMLPDYGTDFTKQNQDEFKNYIMDLLRNKGYITYMLGGSKLLVSWQKDIN